MNISYVKEFLDLAETLSFTKSAINLAVSQSALSRHIAEIEKEVGFKLFSRTTTSVALTREGRAFYEKAVILARDWNNILDLGNLKPTAKTKVLVGGNVMQPPVNRFLHRLSYAASSRGADWCLAFRKPRSLSNEPAVPQPLDMLIAGDLDITVEAMPFNAELPRGCQGFKLCEEPLRAVVSAANPLANAANLKVDDLRGMVPVAFAVYRSCPEMELAPFRAAGLDVSRARTVYVQDMLEVSDRIALLADDEIAPLEDTFCELYGLGGASDGITTTLSMDDDRMSLSYWVLAKEEERRKPVLDALELGRSLGEH